MWIIQPAFKYCSAQNSVSSCRVGVMKAPTLLYEDPCGKHWGNCGKWNTYWSILLCSGTLFQNVNFGLYIKINCYFTEWGKKPLNGAFLSWLNALLSIKIGVSFLLLLSPYVYMYYPLILRSNFINTDITNSSNNNCYQLLIAYLLLGTRWS